MSLLYEVERFLRQSGMAASRFGRIVVRDPAFVRDMRNGREPRAATVLKARAFIAAVGGAAHDAAHDAGHGAAHVPGATMANQAICAGNKAGMAGTRDAATASIVYPAAIARPTDWCGGGGSGNEPLRRLAVHHAASTQAGGEGRANA